MANFERFQRLATRLTAKNGAVVTHRMADKRAKTYDSTEDELTGAEVPSTQSVYAVIEPYAPLFGLGTGTSFESDGRKLTSSRNLTISQTGRVVNGVPGAALSFEPLPGDKFTFEGKTWEATLVKKTGPDGAPIMFEVGVSLP